MSQPDLNASPRAWRAPACGCLAVLLLLLGLGGAAWYFWPAAASPSAALLVYLTSPESGALAEINAPLNVHAMAHSPQGVARLELYADGALVAVETTSLPDGSNPLVFAQPWIPLTAGRHILMLRAYGQHGGFADSDVRTVDVLAQLEPVYPLAVDGLERGPGAPPPSLNDVAGAVGLPAQQILAANPHLADAAGQAGFDPAGPLPAGTTLDIPRTPAPAPGATPTPDPVAGAPLAPGNIGANAGCAAADLSWNASAGATGYTLYRLGGGIPVIARLAALPADQLSYHDPLPALGEWRYQVAAVRDGLEGLSPLVSVQTPGTCVPPTTAHAVDTRVLTFLSLVTLGRYDGVYCYLSLNGAPYERVPAGDFAVFAPEPDGRSYNPARDLPARAQFSLGVPPAGAPLTLSGDCYGRQGLLSVLLGSFAASHLPSDWDGRALQQTAGAGAAGFTLGYRLDANTPDARSLALGTLLGFNVPPVLTMQWPEPLYGPGGPANPPDSQGPPLPDFYNLPWPTNVRIQRSLDGCRLLPDARSQGRCVLGGLLGGGYPTLFWDWVPNVHFSEADLVGYMVRATYAPAAYSLPEIRTWDMIVYRPAGGGTIPRTALIPANIVQNLPCGETYRIVVRALIPAGPGLVQPSGPGILWNNPTRPCPLQARVRVTFERLTLLSAPRFPELLDVNGDPCFLCVDRRLELRDAGGAHQVSPAFWANGAGMFIQSSGGSLFASCADWTLCMVIGEHRLADLPFLSFTRFARDSVQHSGLNSNWVDFPIADLESLAVGYSLVEIDQDGTSTGLQSGCASHIELPARTVEAWSRINETHTLTQTGGGPEGTCQLDVLIEGRVDRP